MRPNIGHIGVGYTHSVAGSFSGLVGRLGAQISAAADLALSAQALRTDLLGAPLSGEKQEGGMLEAVSNGYLDALNSLVDRLERELGTIESALSAMKEKV